MEDIINSNTSRLYDVFFSGPIYIYLSTFVTHKILKVLIFVIGLFTILYNLHNYLYFNNKIDKPIPFFEKFVTTEGKSQVHRLYNLFIMYPFIIYINKLTASNPKKPKWLTTLIYAMVVVGVLYNLYWLYTIANQTHKK